MRINFLLGYPSTWVEDILSFSLRKWRRNTKSLGQYHKIFGNSDSENKEGLGGNSDIDFTDLSSESSDDGNGEIGGEIEQEDEVPLKWTNNFTPITVEQFVSPTEVTFAIANDAREIDIFIRLFGDVLAQIVTETNRPTCKMDRRDNFRAESVSGSVNYNGTKSAALPCPLLVQQSFPWKRRSKESYGQELFRRNWSFSSFQRFIS